MKTIIAGSRDFCDRNLLEEVLRQLPWTITEVVSGGAKGADSLGEEWAYQHKVPVKKFLAKWADLTVANCNVKTGRNGRKYNVLAGFNRNKEMAYYADALLAFWDGKSTGTRDMIDIARNKNLLVEIMRF